MLLVFVIFIFSSLQFENLAGLCLPSKKAFNNMNKDFLEKRRKALNLYLQVCEIFFLHQSWISQ